MHRGQSIYLSLPACLCLTCGVVGSNTGYVHNTGVTTVTQSEPLHGGCGSAYCLKHRPAGVCVPKAYRALCQWHQHSIMPQPVLHCPWQGRWLIKINVVGSRLCTILETRRCIVATELVHVAWLLTLSHCLASCGAWEHFFMGRCEHLALRDLNKCNVGSRHFGSQHVISNGGIGYTVQSMSHVPGRGIHFTRGSRALYLGTIDNVEQQI
jgi:hypothetical protein